MNDFNEPIKEVFSNEVYKDFIKWSKSRNIPYDVSSVKFAVRLKRLNINGISQGARTNKGRKVIYDIDKLKTFLKIDCVENIKEETFNDNEFEEEKN